MPKRSNEFQRLVFLLKQQLGRAATVTESKMLKDLFTGDDREVDICIETVVASEPVMVSIECIDRTRAADIKWVEEMKAKHERLSTNALVLISRNGFSAKAVRLARTYNIRTLTFAETTEDHVARVFGDLDSLWTKVFTLRPTKVIVRVAATGDLPGEDVAAFPDNSIHDADGKVVAVIRDLIQGWFQSPEIREELAKKGNESHKSFVIGWPQPRGKDGVSLYLQKIEPAVLRRVELIEVRGTCTFEVSRFPLRGCVRSPRSPGGSGKRSLRSLPMASAYSQNHRQTAFAAATRRRIPAVPPKLSARWNLTTPCFSHTL